MTFDGYRHGSDPRVVHRPLQRVEPPKEVRAMKNVVTLAGTVASSSSYQWRCGRELVSS
jgi:hypothetical protein